MQQASDTPGVISTGELDSLADAADVLVIDLCDKDTYLRAHIPGAVHMEYPCLIRHCKPAIGLLPEDADLETLLGNMGISNNTRVIAYDNAGGGKAARLLYTLDVAGHDNYALLDGGLAAWVRENRPLDSSLIFPERAIFHVARSGAGIADREYINARLDDASVALMDVRSPDEFSGKKRMAARGGHIPGAIHYEWTRVLDRDNNLRLRPADQIRDELRALGLTPDREIITYCQTHHRSAHSYIVLKWLGYPQVRGYPGAWSDWGNCADQPVEPT